MPPSSDSPRVVTYDLLNYGVVDTYIIDIFSAYSLSPAGLTIDDISRIINNVVISKKTFPFLQEVINSNRYPTTIFVIANKLGMYIPYGKRVGLETYHFFLANIKYYEPLFERAGQQFPEFYDIYMSKDRLNLLMKFRDDEFCRKGYKVTKNYSSRLEMLQYFIEHNILIHGEFSLECNSRTSYSTKAKIITYQKSGEKTSYNPDELTAKYDVHRKVFWKDHIGFLDPKPEYAFSRLNLHLLRQLLLEKFELWRQRDGSPQCTAPQNLCVLFINLETILVEDVRNDTNAYLISPSI